MKKLCVIFGGASTEYEVSLRSAASILRNIDYSKYEVIPVGITKDGRWIRYGGDDWTEIENGSWLSCSGNRPCFISPDRGIHGLVYENGEVCRIDIAFPVLHGKNGEDGTIQGLFELAGIDYVGCGVAASANTMDKVITKLIAEKIGVYQAKYFCCYDKEFLREPEKYADMIIEKLGLPLFVKPSRAGSSVGINKAKTRAELIAYVSEAAEVDNKIVFEEAVVGQEIETSVLGRCDGEIEVGAVGEIRPAQEFYTYSAKYDDEGSLLIIPAEIPEDKYQEVRDTAAKLFKAVDGFGLSRIDFFLRSSDRQVVFNEINAIPGFTSISMYARLFEAVGVSYGELVERLIELAGQRND